MKLPRWLRQLMAKILVSLSDDEIGGVLHNYKNGRWEELATWNNLEELDVCGEIILNMVQSGRDDIYIMTVKLRGFGHGYFLVEDSDCNEYRRDFWTGIYSPDEALMDVAKYCRKVADKMGFRRPDDESK